MMSAKEKICCALIALGQIVGWGGFWLLLMIDDTKSDTARVVRLVVIMAVSLIASYLLMWLCFRQKEKSDTSECGFWISNDTYKIDTNYAKEFAELYERYGEDSDLQSSAKK